MNPKPRQRVFPLQKRLSVRRKAVTIVAGFNFKSGILLCADTKHSGTSKQYATKIFTKIYPSGAKSVFGFSGRSAYARMAISACEKAIQRKSDPTIQEMKDEIEDVLIQIYQKHIFKHPDRNTYGGPDFWLLIGLWAHGELRLYTSNETAVDRVHTFECLGSGESLAKYIITPKYSGPDTSLDSVLFMAITALARIKKHDPNCGGKSYFVVLQSSGEMGYETEFDITQHEHFSDTFFHYATAVYTMMAERAFTDEELKKHIEFFFTDVNNARAQLQTEKDYRKALIKTLFYDN